MAALLAQIGWKKPGSVWSKCAEDLDPAAHCGPVLPDITNFLLAAGSKTNELGVCESVSEFGFGPQASGFGFAARKKSEREWIAESGVRFELAKRETAAPLAQQVDPGAATGPFGRETGAGKRKARPNAEEVDKFVGELCGEAVVEEDAKLMGAERENCWVIYRMTSHTTS